MTAPAASGQATLAVETPQHVWHRPPGKGACVRDPAAGPGSCWYWWEMCPDAEARGCYRLWQSQQRKAAAA